MKNFSFISYKKLRKTWMYQVLDLLSKQELENFEEFTPGESDKIIAARNKGKILFK